MNSAIEVREKLNALYEDVKADKVDTKKANCMCIILSHVLNSIRVDEVERKLEEYEGLIAGDIK